MDQKRKDVSFNINTVYCIISKKKVMNWCGYKRPDEEAESVVVEALTKSDRSRLFMPGDQAFKSSRNGEWVTFIIPGLRQIYPEVDNKDRNYLLQTMCSGKELPTFYNIDEYGSIKGRQPDILYQLIGDITPYDVLHVRVEDLKDTMRFNLPDANGSIITLRYERKPFIDMDVKENKFNNV